MARLFRPPGNRRACRRCNGPALEPEHPVEPGERNQQTAQQAGQRENKIGDSHGFDLRKRQLLRRHPSDCALGAPKGLEMNPNFLDRSPAYLVVKGAVQPDTPITAATIQLLRFTPLPLSPEGQHHHHHSRYCQNRQPNVGQHAKLWRRTSLRESRPYRPLPRDPMAETLRTEAQGKRRQTSRFDQDVRAYKPDEG
jgi:hypothetical protein